MVFLLSRVSIKFYSNLTQEDELEISTWESGKKGALFLREVEFRKNGEVAIAHKSGWVMVDPTTRKIHRPNFYDFNLPIDENRPSKSVELGKIELTKPELIAQKEIKYSDLDCNGHIYNAFYGDFLTDILPQAIYEKNMSEFRINYINEAKLGEKINLYISYENEKHICILGKIILDNMLEKECFCAQIIYE